MLKIISATVLVALAMSLSANGQDVKVIGSGTGSKPKTQTIVKPKGYDRLGVADYECIYAYDVMATNKKGEKVNERYATILQFNPSLAKFTDMASFLTDSVASQPGENVDMTDLNEKYGKGEFFFTGEVYQNCPEGKTTYIDIITPNTVKYEEDFAPFGWALEEDTLTVCGYPCMKATCEYGGRKWTAWFTEEIPASFGPWKFSGLPGLILKVADSEGVHTFTATAFRKGADEIVRVQNSELQSTSRDKFIKNKAYFEEEPMKRVPVESIRSVSVFKGGAIMINDVRLPKRTNGYTPIELE